MSVFKSVFVPILTWSWILGNDRRNIIPGASDWDRIFLKSPRCDTGAYRSELAPGVRNKFGNGAPCSNLRPFGSKCTVLKKKLATLLGLFGGPQWFESRGIVFPLPPWCYRVTLRDKVHRCEIRKVLNVEPLRRMATSQLHWFGHVSKMPHETLGRQVLLAKPTGNRPRGGPRPIWIDYISALSEFVFDLEVFQVLLGLLPTRPSLEEKLAWKWMKWLSFTLFS